MDADATRDDPTPPATNGHPARRPEPVHRVGLRTYLPRTGEARYVSAFTHTQFHATPHAHEALTFASPMQLMQWASAQNAACRHHLDQFRPCPILVMDQGEFVREMALLLDSALAAGLADAESRERSEAEAARKRAARAGKAVAADA